MFARLEKIIFFLLVFFISSQVGLHFWPKFASVSGIRVDYLAPTLYLLDILIIALFLFSIPKLGKMFTYVRTAKFPKVLILLFTLSLIWNLFAAKSSGAHLFGIIKLAEFVFLGIYVAFTFNKKFIRPFIEMLSLSAIVSSTLAIWQYASHSSIGGFWYYFGERTFTSSTIGISTVNLDSQILRAYGAFPHPNVLAFFLFMTIVFATFRIAYEAKFYEKMFLVFTIIISSAALLITFSRISIFLLILFLFYVIYSKLKRNINRISLIIFPIGFLGLLYSIFPFSSQFLLRGIDFRMELLVQSAQIFSSNPSFGIGLNNFFIHQVPLIHEVTPILFQPPHNIYVLALLSLGIFGFWIFPILLFEAVRSVVKKLRTRNKELKSFHQSVFIILLGILVVGFFDHFFLTLEQGQIIFALILGLSFIKFRS